MTKSNRPISRTLGDLLDELADIYTKEESMVWLDERLTFGEFKVQSDILARSLIHLGVKSGDRVALLAPNRPEWLIAAFAVAKIGGITAAISTFSTAPELSWTLRHCEATCLISISSLRGKNFLQPIKALKNQSYCSKSGQLNIDTLPNLKSLISIDSNSDGIVMGWKDCLALAENVTIETLKKRQSSVSEKDICYILYTSGSTAEPKGVMLAHGNVIANGYDIGRRQNLNNKDRLWFAIPLFWSFGAANALPAIMSHGGCAVLQESFEPRTAIELIDSESCTIFYGMANMARSIREQNNWSPHKFRSMRTGLTIGLPEDINMIIDTFGASELCNVYGSTETYGNAAVCASDDSIELRLNSQGLPLPGMKIRAIDLDTKKPLPNGKVGELTVSGYVTPGYFNAPELTAKSFDKEGYFLTGDLGMIGTDGRVYFKGRLKEIIKTGGVNVSPLEVEKVLAKHSDIRQAFVVGIPDSKKDEIVIAVVELNAGIKLSSVDIISFCKKELASYKVPSFISFKTNDEIPQTSTGKINKTELKKELQLEFNSTEN